MSSRKAPWGRNSLENWEDGSELAMYNGVALTEARERKAMSLADASRLLSIPEGTLQALESATFEALPPECFTAGFLRSYCRFLELPADSFVAEYHAALRSPSNVHKSLGERLKAQIAEKITGLIPPLPPELISWAAITAVVLSAWVAYSLAFRPTAPIEENQASAAIQDLRLPDIEIANR
jgi:cytoskeletal protein RodZ